MAMAILIQLSDWVYSLKHSKITQKKIKQFYCDKTSTGKCCCKCNNSIYQAFGALAGICNIM